MNTQRYTDKTTEYWKITFNIVVKTIIEIYECILHWNVLKVNIMLVFVSFCYNVIVKVKKLIALIKIYTWTTLKQVLLVIHWWTATLFDRF